MTTGNQGDTPDAAHDALSRARAAARSAPPHTTKPQRPPSATLVTSGRDPVPLAAAVDGMVAERGWQTHTAIASVTGRWADIVGTDIAAHVEVESFDPEQGSLHLRAESTAWATQIRLLMPTLKARLAEEVGSGVVRHITVAGPTAPSWVKGPRTAPGRGPRDTYG